MATINNPVISGMSPDPSIIRVEDTYYIATSTFHWLPAIQIFESKDLANWDLIGYALRNHEVELRGSNTPTGVWAPHLSYDATSKKYWLSYSHMINMAGREFNANNFAIWSYDIRGPWSVPIYLTSIGFDPALYHDEDGKHYLTILEWETRTGYQSPGTIVLAEIELDSGLLVSDWARLTKGFTTRGNAEAPQLYKHQDYYYLLIAAGGTGYGHGVEIGRSRNIFGPYEPHPSGEPIITSSPRPMFSLGDPDAGHFEMYNPLSPIQKSGHGSLVESPEGEWFMAHLMSRPLAGELLNPLGRETSIQRMHWTADGWLEMADGSNLAKTEFEGPSKLKTSQKPTENLLDDFEEGYALQFVTPYHEQDPSWVTTKERKGYLRIYGRDSLFSKVEPSIMATRATSFNYSVQTKLTFHPYHFSETAGLGLYYDSNNWLYAHLTYCERQQGTVLTILQAELGARKEFVDIRINIPNQSVELKICYNYGCAQLFYRLTADSDWIVLTEELDVKCLSDEGVNGEPGEIGGFTGLFNFIGAVDAKQHQTFADFDYYYVTAH